MTVFFPKLDPVVEQIITVSEHSDFRASMAYFDLMIFMNYRR